MKRQLKLTLFIRIFTLQKVTIFHATRGTESGQIGSGMKQPKTETCWFLFSQDPHQIQHRSYFKPVYYSRNIFLQQRIGHWHWLSNIHFNWIDCSVLQTSCMTKYTFSIPLSTLPICAAQQCENGVVYEVCVLPSVPVQPRGLTPNVPPTPVWRAASALQAEWWPLSRPVVNDGR